MGKQREIHILMNYKYLVFLHNPYYELFKCASDYSEMKKVLKRKFNHCKACDFDYLGVLGQGGRLYLVYFMM